MKRIVLTDELMAPIEDAACDWELSEDGRRLDVGPDLWQLHDRWILNDDGSLDQYKKRERVQMSVGGVAVARMKYYEVDFASHVLLASIPDLVESLTGTTGEPLFGLRDDRG